MLNEDQIPLPCTACGAPMHEATTSTGTLTIACNYCGAAEALPADLEERVHYLRCRLAHLASAKQRVHGFARGVLAGWKNILPGWLLLFAVIAIHFATQTIPELVDVIQHPPGTTDAQRQEAITEQLAPIVRVVFALGAPAMTLLAGYIYTRVRILPLLQARPPRQGGGRPRCRCCGGSLTNSRDAFLDCPWCGGQNIVTAKLAQTKAASADADARDLQRSRDAAALDLHALVLQYRNILFGVITLAVLGQFALPPIVFALVQLAW